MAQRAVIVRNEVEGDAESYGEMPVGVTVFSPDDVYNGTPGWETPDFQLDVHAYVYSYDPDTGIYTYERRALNGSEPGKYCTGVHLGGQNETGRLDTKLGPNEALLIVPQTKFYAFTYRIEAGDGYSIDSVDDAGRGTLTTFYQSQSGYDSGLVGAFTNASYVEQARSVSHEVVVLHSSRYGTPTPMFEFTQLTNANIGEGRQIRPLKVNLFDYDIPDDWHFVSSNTNTQGDVQLRFVSESSTNTGDGAVNRSSKPYTGILQDTLDASTGLPTFNYTTPFANLGGLFSLTDGTQDVGTAYKWVVTTNETTQYWTQDYSTTPGDTVHQLARPDSPETWYNGPITHTTAGDLTYENVRTKDVYANVDFDFVYDEASGYYSYDSSRNHAQLSDDGTEVHQYDHALGIGGTPNRSSYRSGWTSHSYADAVSDTNGSRAAGFFPFDSLESSGSGSYGQNHYGKQYRFQPAWSSDGTTRLRKEEDLDYHFGLSTTQAFAVPEGGQVKGHDMVFSFSGDDDFWLFVDGKLVLDIGGIHERCPGVINFTKGTYAVNGTTKSLDDIFDGYDASFPNADSAAGSGSWAAGTTHTFSIFYLERGGTFSNLLMRFNLPVGTVRADKVWDDNDDALGLRQDATLHLEKTEGDVTADSTWTDVEGSERTIAADAADATAIWMSDEFPTTAYDRDGSVVAVHYRVVEGTLGDAGEHAPGYTAKVELRCADGSWAESGEAYDAALAAGGASAWRVTNTLTTTKVAVENVWDDKDDADRLRPSELTVSVKSGDAALATLVLNEANDWKAATGELAATDAQGEPVSFEVVANPVEGYTTTVSEPVTKDGVCTFTITNVHKPADPVKPTDPEKPADTKKPGAGAKAKAGTPKTGDPTSCVAAIAGALTGSGAVVAAWGLRRRARR